MKKCVVEVAYCVELKKKNYDAFAACASARALEGEDVCGILMEVVVMERYTSSGYVTLMYILVEKSPISHSRRVSSCRWYSFQTSLATSCLT